MMDRDEPFAARLDRLARDPVPAAGASVEEALSWAAACLSRKGAPRRAEVLARVAACGAALDGVSPIASTSPVVVDALVGLALVGAHAEAPLRARARASIRDAVALIEGFPGPAAVHGPRAAAWLSLPGGLAPARPILQALRDAAAQVPASPAELAGLAQGVTRTMRLRTWQVWRGRQPEVARRDFAPLVAERLAAAGSAEEYERFPLGEALGGEVTLARAPDRLLLEWFGAAAPPARALLAGGELAEAPASLRQTPAAWELGAAPEGPMVLVFERGGEQAQLVWP